MATATKSAQNVQCSKCASYFNPRSIKGAAHLAGCRIYNGWRNYETWAVNMHVAGNYDGEGTYKHWQNAGREALAEAKESRDSVDGMPVDRVTERARALLSERLEREFEDAAHDAISAPGVMGDLLHGALSDVDWFAVADGILEGLA